MQNFSHVSHHMVSGGAIPKRQLHKVVPWTINYAEIQEISAKKISKKMFLDLVTDT